jgi:hypothetical protein
MMRTLARFGNRVARACHLAGLRAAERRSAEQQRAERMVARTARLVAKQQLDERRRLRRQEVLRRTEQARFAREAGASAYAHYLEVRSWARRLSGACATTNPAFTPQEREIAAGLSPLWEATPAMIAELRRWCQPMSDIGQADYESSSSALAKRLRRDLKRQFMEVGRDLFVPEPDILGAFGYEAEGGRYNADTLKFFYALVALQDAAVLGDLGSGGRRLVWEPGGGWGGFAYQLKTVCPDITYLITGVPELLLVSAIYLKTVCPGARCRLFDPGCPDSTWKGWDTVDFVFAPEAALPDLRPPRLDLAVDLLCLRHLNPARLETHIQWAFESNGRYFYSMHSDSYCTGDLPAVWRALERRYWIHPVPPRIEVAKADVEYSHAVGWKRLRG